MRYIPCSIDLIHTPQEDGWIISVPQESAADAALDFAALHLGHTQKIIFSDGVKHLIICPEAIIFEEHTIPVDAVWIDAIWSLFLDCHRNGWSDTAHIDQEFFSDGKPVLLTMEIAFTY